MANLICSNPVCQKKATEYSVRLIMNPEGHLAPYRPILCEACGSEMMLVIPAFSSEAAVGVGINKFKGMSSDMKKEVLKKRASADYNKFHKKGAQQRKSEMIKQIKDSIERPE